MEARLLKVTTHHCRSPAVFVGWLQLPLLLLLRFEWPLICVFACLFCSRWLVSFARHAAMLLSRPLFVPVPLCLSASVHLAAARSRAGRTASTSSCARCAATASRSPASQCQRCGRGMLLFTVIHFPVHASRACCVPLVQACSPCSPLLAGLRDVPCFAASLFAQPSAKREAPSSD